MRRILVVTAGSIMMLALMTGPALAAHCINQSKPDGAGNHGYILLDPGTEEIIGVSEGLQTSSGHFRGGFVDVYIDFNGNGNGDEGEVVVEDTYIAANHSLKEGEPFVVPGAFHNPSDQGIGLADEGEH